MYRTGIGVPKPLAVLLSVFPDITLTFIGSHFRNKTKKCVLKENLSV